MYDHFVRQFPNANVIFIEASQGTKDKAEFIKGLKDELEKVTEDMSQAEGVINLPDLELDPTTNELLGSEAVSLCLGAITPEEFANEIDESIAANAPD